MPKLDLNQEEFQNQFLLLEKPEQLAFLKTMRKLKTLTWNQIYQDAGLKWEAISADEYSIRITQKCRAVVKRRGDEVSFISLHPDHDSAYE